MRALSAVLFASVLFACSSNDPVKPPAGGDGGADTSVDDASVPDAADAAPPPHFPAFTPEIAQVVDNKGGVLTNPKIVSVTWSSDPNEAFYQKFTDTIGQSDFWKTTVTEYGVGPATSGGHVSITTPPPATIQSDALDTWVAQQVAGAPGNGWVQNDPNTLYLLFLPESLKLTLGGNTECNSGVGGYHTETTANGASVVYGIVGLECHSVYGTAVTPFATQVGSHEIAEAVTDPHPGSGAGFYGYDDKHWAWAELLDHQYEIGDACEFFGDSVTAFSSPPYVLQREWSNLSGKSGHNPCEPNPDPYFSVAPLGMVDVTIHDQTPTSNYKKIVTKGYNMQVGVQASIDFGFYSDGPLPKWSVTAVEGPLFSGFAPPSPTLTLALQTHSGKDGDVGTLYVTPNFPSPPGGTLVTIISQGTAKHYAPFLIMVTK